MANVLSLLSTTVSFMIFCWIPPSFQGMEPAETMYDTVAKDTIKSKMQDKVGGGGKVSRDSGRIYIVVHHQKQYHFGKMSNQEVKKTREKNLQINNPPLHILPINVFTLTFNAGNCNLADFNGSLAQWLPNTGKVDLYALAFQELNDTTKKKKGKGDEEDDDEEEKKKGKGDEEDEEEKGDGDQLHHQQGDNQQEELLNYFLEYLGEDYCTVQHYKMWQTRLFLFTKREHHDQISSICSHHCTTGIGGIVKVEWMDHECLESEWFILCIFHVNAHWIGGS